MMVNHLKLLNSDCSEKYIDFTMKCFLFFSENTFYGYKNAPIFTYDTNNTLVNDKSWT